MADVVDVGALPDDGTGDEWRTAFIAINVALAAAAQHAADIANPHGTTAAQVGAYTKAEADSKIQDFLLQVQAGVVSPAQLAAALSGIVVANSSTPITLVEGESRTLTLSAPTRSGFSPGTFALITRTSTTANYAVIQPTAYDATAGTLTFTVRTVVGDPGPFSDWQVASLAGSTVAQYAMLALGQSARDDAIAARNTAKDWATKTSGEVIPGLGFGAKKYAQDASGFASAASASADRAATFDPNSYYSKTTIDGKFSDLKGTASAAYDTLGELETGVTTNASAISSLATTVGANTTAIAATDAKANRALRVTRLYTAANFP